MIQLFDVIRVPTLIRSSLIAVFGLLVACGPDGSVIPKQIAPPPERAAAEGPADPVVAEEADPTAAPEAGSIKIAVLLPLSGPSRDVALALRQAATLALFDAYDPRLALLPFDTKGSQEGALAAAGAAIDADVDLVLGPLFSENAQAVAPVFAAQDLTMISFSNDPAAAAPGAYVFGYQIRDEVNRVVNFARDAGHSAFAALLPEGRYGDQVQSVYAESVFAADANLTGFERFPADPDGFDAPVRRLGSYDARRRAYRLEIAALEALEDDLADEIKETYQNREVIGDPDFDAVLVAEGGELLRGLAPLLPFYEIDPAKVKLLGTGVWNDPALLREPPLQGAWFAAPEPSRPAQFYERFEAEFGYRPARLSTLAYDAFALVAAMTRDADGLSNLDLEREEGFSGIDGPVRFLESGLSERMFAVLEVGRRGFRIVDPAPTGFPSFGYMVMTPEGPAGFGAEGR